MPKPMKKAARSIKAADQPIVDPGTVIREHVQELREKGGEARRREIAKRATAARLKKG